MNGDGPADGSGADLTLRSVTKRFGSFVAVDDLDLTVERGRFYALLGPSGCGKTTTLRMVAGLEEPTSGRIELGGQDISHLKPYRRPVNTVFQSYALFPHLDIGENVAFGLRRRGVKDVKRQVEEMLELVELAPYARRRPAQLSGGQQQRVALARALINRPQVLLLDEPLGALDLKLRRQMQLELKRIQTEVGITFIHVTHDQEEAMTMADTIAVMNAGVIEQQGDPATLYDNPATTFVSNFLGQSNLVLAKVLGAGSGAGPEVVVDAHGSRVGVRRERAHCDSGEGWLGVRPEKVSLSRTGEDSRDGTNVLPGGRVTDVSYIGVSTQYLVAMPWGQELTVFEQNTGERTPMRHGDEVDLHWLPEHSFLLDADQDALAGAEVEGVSAVQAATAPAAAAVADTDDTTGDSPRRRGRTGYLLLLPGLLWLLVFFAVPTVQLVGTSLYDRLGSLDTGYSMTWSFGNYWDALSSYQGPFLRSLWYSLACTALAVLLGYPLAYAIAFKAGRWRNLMLVAVVAPFFTSFLVRTLAWKAILADNGIVVNTLQAVHLLGSDGRLLATWVAVVTGLTYNFLPFMVLPLYASLEKIDPRLIEAGADLYASPVTAFRKITLPLSMPGLVAGTLLTFIPAAGDYVNAQLLGTPRQYMIGNVIDNTFLVQLDYPIAGACSVILMVVIVAMVLVYVRRAGAEELL